ncbi:penicillin-binding protein activator [Roseomonas sp. NAR14]|uniref:Penicillin-binding protein activator n=2 Tax=Roseomonas acroporae TaxID=2937791 RepID=A0A9X2BW80_9PROT|nr:penicillin-binding protein activator [Roseomonas acroporae]MCK8784754.1 penicillin-binding protein activator [Roseomonas acroporae]
MPRQGQALPAEQPLPPRTRIGLLLPLSGGNAPIGQAMLSAAQLALFEQGDNTLELAPYDTRGTGAGAAEAARSALASGARLLVGPLTAGETAAVAQTARPAQVPVLAFTSDSAQAGGTVWVLGVTPAQQVRRVVGAALSRGARRFALVAPEGEFGRRLAAAMNEALAGQGLPGPAVAYFPPRGDAMAALRSIAVQGGATPPPAAPAPPPPGTPEALPPAEAMPAPEPVRASYDAILIAESGEKARRLAAGLAEAGISVPVRLLGTALWATDPGLGSEPALVGAWFPGADPVAQSQFDGRYQAAFGERAPPLAGIAYDATGLAVRAARGGSVRDPGTGELFLGAAGPLRLLPDGRAQRGLAVLEVQPGQPVLLEPAAMPDAGS